MTSDEFKAIRFKLGLSGLEWGRMLGYAGKSHNVRVQVRRWEQEVRPIPPWIELLSRMHGEHGLLPSKRRGPLG